MHLPNTPENIDATHRAFMRLLLEEKPWRCPVLSHKNIADMLHVPTSFLAVVFRRKGVNFLDTLRRMRLEEAVRLLEGNPELGIYDAAMKAGFGSRIAFDAAYRNRYGHRPCDRFGAKRGSKSNG